MPDQLSISNLLSLLVQVDRQHAAIKLCYQAESLRRRHHYAEAIRVAENAVQMVHNDYGTIGVALLYLSQMRLASHVPHEEDLAIRDCDRAIRSLGVTPFNQAIANLIRAQIEVRHPNDEHRSILVYLDRADKILERLIKTEHEHHRLNQLDFYKELRQHIAKKIDEVSSKLVEVPPIVIPPKIGMPVAPPPFRLPIPTSLVWPEPKPVQIEFSPAGNSAFDLDVTSLMINNLHYNVQPVFPTSGGRSTLRLHQRQRYLALQVARKEDGFVLVRQQDRLDQDRQIVAVVNRTQHRAWVDEAKSAAPYTHVRIIGGDREWTINDDTETQESQSDELTILGIIEAILTPVEVA